MGDPSGQLQDGLLDRAGVFRVDIDGAALECLETNEGAAEGIAALDGEATILQELGHDLGQHLPLEVLLATDDDRAFRRRGQQATGPGQEDNQDGTDTTAPRATAPGVSQHGLALTALIRSSRSGFPASPLKVSSGAGSTCLKFAFLR